MLETTHLKDDLLTGAAAIAAHLGPPWNERKIYHAAAKRYLPIGRVGQILIARKSELDKFLSGDITPIEEA